MSIARAAAMACGLALVIAGCSIEPNPTPFDRGGGFTGGGTDGNEHPADMADAATGGPADVAIFADAAAPDDAGGRHDIVGRDAVSDDAVAADAVEDEDGEGPRDAEDDAGDDTDGAEPDPDGETGPEDADPADVQLEDGVTEDAESEDGEVGVAEPPSDVGVTVDI